MNIERQMFQGLDRLPFDLPYDYYDNCTASEIQLSGKESSIVEVLDSLSGYSIRGIDYE